MLTLRKDDSKTTARRGQRAVAKPVLYLKFEYGPARLTSGIVRPSVSQTTRPPRIARTHRCSPPPDSNRARSADPPSDTSPPAAAPQGDGPAVIRFTV